MEHINTLLFFSCLLVIMAYAVLLIRGLIAWNLYPTNVVTNETQAKTFITVIVAVRNEATNILNCLNQLDAQSYPYMEVIISDDFSEDNTREIISSFIHKSAFKNKSWKLLSASESDKTGKKAALERAINQAKGELILTTDADCSMGKDWVNSFAGCFNKTGASMITGLVKLSTTGKLSDQMQALEFLSLSGTGAVSVILHKPLLCNGANLAFTKKAFADAGGYKYGNELSSGDDVFLMLQINKSGPNKIVFNKSHESIVITNPVAGWNEFISQRKRWASKVNHYAENYIKITGALILLVNLILIFLLVAAVFDFFSWQDIAGLWLIKITADLIFLFPLLRFARQQHLLFLFLPAVMLYPIYIISSLFSAPANVNYTWKGRSYTVSK